MGTMFHAVPNRRRGNIQPNMYRKINAGIDTITMCVPGCCDVANDFLDTQIRMNDFFAIMYAGVVSVQDEMMTLRSHVSEEEHNVSDALDSLRNEISSNKSEFDSLTMTLSAKLNRKADLNWLRKLMEIKKEIKLIPNAEYVCYDELIECLSANRMARIRGVEFVACIKIPVDVECIAEKCFSGCGSLLSVTFSSGSHLKIIESEAFKNCKKLKSIEIPVTVESLGDHCFYQCKDLQNVTIPNNVKSLGHYCFSGCSSLKNVAIGNCVTLLGNGCFYGCSSLKNVTIPNSMESLGIECFSDCENLKNVTIGNRVRSLGYRCFYGCQNLKSLKIPQHATLGLWFVPNGTSISYVGTTGVSLYTVVYNHPLW